MLLSRTKLLCDNVVLRLGWTLTSSSGHSIRGISTSSTGQFQPLWKAQSGRFRASIKGDKPLTYEEYCKCFEIQMKKSWTSYNTSSFPLQDGLRKMETSTEDLFIRRFLLGTWHNVMISEVIIKRQGNLIRCAAIVQRTLTPRKMYFLIGYCEDLLSYWIQCPVKLELQTVDSKKDIVYRYV